MGQVHTKITISVFKAEETNPFHGVVQTFSVPQTIQNITYLMLLLLCMAFIYGFYCLFASQQGVRGIPGEQGPLGPEGKQVSKSANE